MKNLLFLFTAFFLTLSADADVTIIESKITGMAIKTTKNIYNVMSPTITMDGEIFKLGPSSSTATAACKMLGMTYVNYSSKFNNNFSTVVYLREDESVHLLEGTSVSMNILTCRKDH